MALAYTGIYPTSNLGLGTANTVYMPVFFYSPCCAGPLSKIHVQNAGRNSLVLPSLQNCTGLHWYADIIVQNMTGESAWVTLDFFDQQGGFVTEKFCELRPYAFWELYGQIPNSFEGTVEIVSLQVPVAVVANLLNDNQLDGASSYGAVEYKRSSTLGLPGEDVPTE